MLATAFCLRIGQAAVDTGRTRFSKRDLHSVPRDKLTLYGIVMFANNFPRPRRANGATQTFRRPSNAPTTANSAHQRDGSASQPRTSTDSPGVYIPPHSASRNGIASEHRYSKDQLLHLYKSQYESENNADVPSSLYIGGWEPSITNGNSSASWGRRDDLKDTHGGDLCWDRGAQAMPLGLNGFTEEEKDVRLVFIRK